jgi:hypothetical protein
MYDEVGRMWKEAVTAYFKKPTCNFIGGTEETHEKQ